ncbi:nicotinate phosphoribosyltransferase [Candidatus Kaiserbacteria bacterium]|nr:nicotinate phosphoribosyltransferase [Candidatus Kaiserbacteria bacterium]
MELWKRDRPIIESLLEIDVYKLLMLNFIDRFYPNLEARFTLKNRTNGVEIAKYIDKRELEDQLAHVAGLRFSGTDVAYLRTWGVFPEHFLRGLSGLRLPPLSVAKYHCGGALKLDVSARGRWSEVTLWETIVLAIVNELYTRGYVRKQGLSEQELVQMGIDRLEEKMKILMKNLGVRFAQFGLRRRFSGAWEEYITRVLANAVPKSMVGVSNIRLARDLGVEAVGTNAHELPMALYALARHASDEAARQAPYEVLRQWQMLYGQRLLVMLPDTFGTDSFLDGLSRQYALDWRGSRQDSGDPYAYGEKWLAFYKKHGIDARDKLIIFSDGLDAGKMVSLYERFSPHINVSFGWGTNLTNDLGVPPLSLVMKLAEAAGNPATKLSDNIAKATGPEEEIRVAKRIFGYDVAFNEQPMY